MAATRSGIINAVSRIINPAAGSGGTANVLQIAVLAGADTFFFTDDLANAANWPLGAAVTISAAVTPAGS